MTDSKLSFDERHPTSIRLEKVVGGGIAVATAYVLFAFIFMTMFQYVPSQMTTLLMFFILFWGSYVGYRVGKRCWTTFTVEGNRVTISSASTIYPFIKSERTSVLGRDTIVELVPSHGWWIPKDLLAMEGDDVQWFSDIAITTIDDNGRAQRILVSRDRATRDVMMQRREKIEAMLEGSVARTTA